MNNSIDNIDEYLTNTLDSEQRKAFESALQNPKFAQEVEFHQEVIQMITARQNHAISRVIRSVEDELDREGFFLTDQTDKQILKSINLLGETKVKKITAEIDEELKESSFYESHRDKSQIKVLSIKRRNWIAIAASILILVIAGIIYIPQKSTGPELFARSYLLPNDVISEELEAEKGEMGFAGDQETLQALQLAMDQFNAGQFPAFLRASELLLNESSLDHYQNQILFYRGIALMEDHQYDLAILELANSNYADADYYRMMSHLALDQIDQAKEIALELQASDSLREKLISKVRKM